MFTRITPPVAVVPLTARPPEACLKLAIALIETMMGRRSLHMIRRVVCDSAFDRIASYRYSGAFINAKLQGMRCQMPTETAAEISVRISAAARWRVCVLRMDFDQAWRCSDFAVLGA